MGFSLCNIRSILFCLLFSTSVKPSSVNKKVPKHTRFWPCTVVKHRRQYSVHLREDTSVVRRYEKKLDNKALFFVKFVLFVTVLWTLFCAVKKSDSC